MKKFLPAILAATVLSSCAPSTPQARIDKDPESFARLTSKEQSLVRDGQISRGMSTDAVRLAWGPPSRSFEGSRESRPSERWDYTTLRPVHFTSSPGYGGFGYGNFYGPYGRRGFHSIGPDVAFVPEHVGSVWFINHRVDSWERLR